MTTEVQTFAIGSARNVTLRCANGHYWFASEKKSERMQRFSINPNAAGYGHISYVFTTAYYPGLCQACHAEPVAIEERP